MEWRQKTISENFNGDVEKFDEAYAFAVAEGRRYAIQWQTIIDAATTLPELNSQAQDLIERLLGYLPHASVTLAFEPFLRGLIQLHQQETISDEAFTQQAEEHIKLIRNADMNDNTCLAYDARIYDNYESYLKHYAQDVRNRLKNFLGYEPNLEHSLVAELWMREVMSKDTFQLPSRITQIDLKAITLIRYREALLDHGKEIADASPLFGIEPAIL